jgi:hypothetical protein
MSIVIFKKLICYSNKKEFWLFEKPKNRPRSNNIILKFSLNKRHRRKFREDLNVCILGRNSGQCGHHTLGLSGPYFGVLVIQKLQSV